LIRRLIGVDANILVYPHRRNSPWHGRARTCLQALAGGRAAWAICIGHGVHELLAADRDFSRFPSLRSRNPLLD